MIGGDVGEAAGKQHREDAVFANGFVERGDEVLLGNGAFGEVLFHELVFAFSDQFDQGFVGGFGAGNQAGGDFVDLASTVAVRRVEEGLHSDQVDDAVETTGIGNWKLDGDTGATPALVEIVDEGAQALATASFGVVHLVDNDDARHIGFFGVAPHALGDGLDTGLGVDDYSDGFNRQQGSTGFVGEHVEAGGVDEIDFVALPFGEGDGVLHGGAAGDFFFVVDGDGRAIFDAALGGSHLGGMQQCGNQGGLAAVRMPHYSYVADLTSLVRFHGSPFFLGLE